MRKLTSPPRRPLAFVLSFALLVLTPFVTGAQQSPRCVPTIDDLLMLESAGASRISPDGRWVAYTVAQTNFKEDAFVTQIWVASTSAAPANVQLTRGSKSSSNPHWSPDGKWLGFISDRVGDRNQIFAIRPDGGEAVQLTKSETPVSNFDWSDDGRTIAYVATEPQTKAAKDHKEQYGEFQVVRKDYAFAHLWTFDVAEALEEPAAGRQRTKGRDFTIGGFSWSPDGTRIAFSAAINPDLVQGGTSDIYVIDLGRDEVKKIVSQPGPDNSPRWSPDGKQLVFSSAMGNKQFFHANSRLAVVSASGGTPAFHHRSLRRAAGPRRLERRRHLLLRTSENGGTSIPRRSNGCRDHPRQRAGRPHGRRLQPHP